MDADECDDEVMDFLGSAAFSKAVQALDIKTGMLVCLKIVKVGRFCMSLPSHQHPASRHHNASGCSAVRLGVEAQLYESDLMPGAEVSL